MFGAMDLGVANDRERADGEQAAQIAVALLADAAKLLFTATRALFWYQSNPG